MKQKFYLDPLAKKYLLIISAGFLIATAVQLFLDFIIEGLVADNSPLSTIVRVSDSLIGSLALLFCSLTIFNSLRRKIVEHKQSEQALRESEQRYRELFTDAQRQAQELELLHRVRNSFSEALDLTTLVRLVVEAIRETFGYTQVSVYLREGDKLILQHQVGYDHVISEINISQGISGKVVRSKQPILLKDVRSDPDFLGAIEGLVSEVCVPLLDQGRVVGTLNVESTDGVILTENDLRLLVLLSDHLNRMIERVRLYTELVEAREEALAASRYKSEFVTNISHELRTPLNAVIGMTELLRTTTLDTKQQEFVEITRQSSELLLTLINDVLDFSKIEANKMNLESVDFDLARLAEEILELVKPKALEKELTLLSFVDPRIQNWVKGDPTRLRQVLLNLLWNALKFTEAGHVTLQIELKKVSEKAVTIQFEVSDTGIGIAPEAIQKLFQPFTQEDNSTTRRYGGSGLGLSICEQLVKLMGGKIEVESKLKVGSVFWFSLTFDCAKQIVTPAYPYQEQLQGIRVLIGDSSEIHRKIIQKYLASWNINFETVTTGQQVLKRLHQAAILQPFDLALLEINLPDLTGFQLAELIREDESLQHTRLILVANCNQLTDKSLGHFDLRLSRPIHQSQLYQSLVQLNSGLYQPLKKKPLTTTLTATSPKAYQILLVEDNPINQKLAQLQLQQLNYAVTLASSGQEALDILSRESFDLILMDCQMPIMDGFEATRRFRKQEQIGSRHVPIIAVTAGALSGDREKCLEAGMDDYLPKPVKIGQLQSIIERWLSPKVLSKETTANFSLTEKVPAATPNLPVLDLEVLASLRELQIPDEVDLVEELVDVFLKSSETSMTELHETIDQQDAARLYQVGHRLYGASANMGARAFAALCRELESLGRAGMLAEARDILRQLDLAYSQLCQALLQFVREDSTNRVG